MIIKIVSFLNLQIQKRRKIENCYITYSGSWDGGGAQIHNIISIMVFARNFRLSYLHTPVKNIEHFNEDRTTYSEKWERYFNLGMNELKLLAFKNLNLKVKQLAYPVFIKKKKNTIYIVNNCHAFCNSFPDYYKEIIPTLRNKYYYQDKNKSSHFDNFTLCVHFRRGDVSESENYSRFTPNGFIEQKLSLVLDVLTQSEIDCKLKIVSQGSKEDFLDFERFKPEYCLNLDELESFNLLVKADILITAKSSFSYVAGLFNRNIVMYDPFWHKPLREWVELNRSNSFIKRELFAQLKGRQIFNPKQ